MSMYYRSLYTVGPINIHPSVFEPTYIARSPLSSTSTAAYASSPGPDASGSAEVRAVSYPMGRGWEVGWWDP